MWGRGCADLHSALIQWSSEMISISWRCCPISSHSNKITKFFFFSLLSLLLLLQQAAGRFIFLQTVFFSSFFFSFVCYYCSLYTFITTDSFSLVLDIMQLINKFLCNTRVHRESGSELNKRVFIWWNSTTHQPFLSETGELWVFWVFNLVFEAFTFTLFLIWTRNNDKKGNLQTTKLDNLMFFRVLIATGTTEILCFLFSFLSFI